MFKKLLLPDFLCLSSQFCALLTPLAPGYAIIRINGTDGAQSSPRVPREGSGVPPLAAAAPSRYPPVFLHPLQSPSLVEPALEVVLRRLQQGPELAPVHSRTLPLRIGAVKQQKRPPEPGPPRDAVGRRTCLSPAATAPDTLQEDEGMQRHQMFLPSLYKKQKPKRFRLAFSQ